LYRNGFRVPQTAVRAGIGRKEDDLVFLCVAINSLRNLIKFGASWVHRSILEPVGRRTSDHPRLDFASTWDNMGNAAGVQIP
jgi:hypothetical protein